MTLSIPLLFLALALVALVQWLVRRVYFSPFWYIPGPASTSFLKGNIHQLVDRHSSDWTRNFVETYGPVSKLYGPFGREWLHLADPKALHSVAVKDQDIWLKTAARPNNSLLGPGLLTTEGAQHRKQRKMLTPVFSIAYLRNITSLFYETSYKLRDALLAEVGAQTKETDILNWAGRAALELVGQGALGYSFDPLTEDVSDDFAESVKSFLYLAVLRAILGPLVFLGPSWLRRMVVSLIPAERVQRMKKIVDTMYSKSVQIIDEKKAAMKKGDTELLRQVGEGKDVMSILRGLIVPRIVKANMAASEKERLSDEELVAQISTFILAGMDTTSNATSRLLHILACNPDVQTKLRNEILDAQAEQEVSYDRLMGLPYLDAVCRETLRLCVIIFTIRAMEQLPKTFSLLCSATQDTILPLHEPIRGTNGSLISEISVPKGTVAILNLLACNTNKALWGEDALEWKPERWLAPLPRAVDEARIPGVYSNLMSFHGGGRSCIGFKYAQLELKVMLSVLLANFKFELTDKPIVWNNAGVAYPTIGKESKKPEMPLKLTAIKH
ncbi:cytochrome P450 [Fomes fomentarius]|nr:cytochrome P450 [Fomes fomentarius]